MKPSEPSKRASPATRARGRPPKNEASHGETRASLIRAGVAILTEKGYSSVGLDEILSSVSVPKGSFYYYFESKAAFGHALIDAYADYFARKLDHWLTNEARAPLQRLKDFIEDAKEGMARHGFRRGCLVGNLGQEMGALPEPFRAQLVAVLADWQMRTARCLRQAQQEQYLAGDADCERLAAFFWIGWEGAVLRAKLEHSAEPLDTFADGFFSALSAHSHRRPASSV
ncbi:TetR/AcrR family transcriptional regulator [Allopusillimonas ginsengisoli]|uniref:acrylate utilization transcriptional regulator AcuR n=1 Tax=Allopusillimonas ginsengisoli TaxID=453575 RepID=UPI001021F2ED|nr:TetR/AcrR family transcriptional regulator [Allopusillimonas ginsengisoli]TEA70024.1 TetR family transcriptional regulator [Allopusillimonas ginsengisoli]